MLYSPAFTFSSVYPLVFLPCAGLRLGVLRQFQAFLASTACAACASSYHFSGIAPLPWRRAFSQFAPVVKLGFPVLASGSNCAVKPTRLRRSAYFRSLASQQERMCSVSFSLLCSPLAFGRAMKNTNLNAQHSNFKKLIFQVVLPGETEALI